MSHETDFLSEGFLLDVVDDEWRMDTLPDDDVPLPHGLSPPSDENDDTQSDLQPNAPETWNELGLHTVGDEQLGKFHFPGHYCSVTLEKHAVRLMPVYAEHSNVPEQNILIFHAVHALVVLLRLACYSWRLTHKM
ncbi:hypothetical protein CYMTET_18962 [Cymbomonas tetramitiformis]|uniref:Anaphase-promoting complex subunit 13 n=1 Tax=Cymbomonas tetramitiformis TaxID=36881 RepID=A0AAE0G715_9CHLO|nr:hypothetical protein CYMTET_18962 [Cymbomonas tetramitiformis]